MPKRYSIVPPRNHDDSVVKLDQVEQQIITTMMKIDANISRANNIIHDRIMPVLRRYSETTQNIGDNVNFWKTFFESSANVIIDTDGTNVEVSERTATTTGSEPPSEVVSMSFNSIEGHTGAPSYPNPALQKNRRDTDTDTVDSQVPQLENSVSYLHQRSPKKPSPVRKPKSPSTQPPAAAEIDDSSFRVAADVTDYERGFRAGFRVGLSPHRDQTKEPSLTLSPPNPRLSEYSQVIFNPQEEETTDSIPPQPQLESELDVDESLPRVQLPRNFGSSPLRSTVTSSPLRNARTSPLKNPTTPRRGWYMQSTRQSPLPKSGNVTSRQFSFSRSRLVSPVKIRKVTPQRVTMETAPFQIDTGLATRNSTNLPALQPSVSLQHRKRTSGSSLHPPSSPAVTSKSTEENGDNSVEESANTELLEQLGPDLYERFMKMKRNGSNI